MERSQLNIIGGTSVFLTTLSKKWRLRTWCSVLRRWNELTVWFQLNFVVPVPMTDTAAERSCHGLVSNAMSWCSFVLTIAQCIAAVDTPRRWRTSFSFDVVATRTARNSHSSRTANYLSCSHRQHLAPVTIYWLHLFVYFGHEFNACRLIDMYFLIARSHAYCKDKIIVDKRQPAYLLALILLESWTTIELNHIKEFMYRDRRCRTVHTGHIRFYKISERWIWRLLWLSIITVFVISVLSKIC